MTTQETTSATKPLRNEGKNYRYLQLLTEEGTGNACIYLEWKKQGNDISYAAGLSFCSPKDSFVKDLARKMASDRFAKDRKKRVAGTIPVMNKDISHMTIQESENVLRDILKTAGKQLVELRDRSGGYVQRKNSQGDMVSEKHSIVPNWAQRAIERGNFKIGLRQE